MFGWPLVVERVVVASKRQGDVLRVICEYRDEHMNSPTLAEIGKRLGITPQTVHQHVAALVRKGLLRRGTVGASRTWLPTEQQGEKGTI
jgi:predicted ArsR family transcriptional regulator